MSRKLITIGIPFYNDSLYLDQAIKSVFNQSYTDWNLILIDDGSSDGSLDIAKKYSYDSRVDIISDGKNKKLASRLNQIIEISNTKYIVRMDADDIMHTDRLLKQLKIMEENPAIDVLGSNAISIDQYNNILGVRKKISDKVVKVEGFIHPSVFAKTDWFKQHRYDEFAERSQDSLLWNRTKNISNFFSVMEPLLYYREIEGSYYKKYFKSSLSFFNVIFNNKYLLSKFYLVKNSLILWIKGCIYFSLSIIGRENFLMDKRNLSLNKTEFDYFYLEMEKSLI